MGGDVQREYCFKHLFMNDFPKWSGYDNLTRGPQMRGEKWGKRHLESQQRTQVPRIGLKPADEL